MPQQDDNDNSHACMPARQSQRQRGETMTTMMTAARARLHDEDNSSMCTPAQVTCWVFLQVDLYPQDRYGFSAGSGVGRCRDTREYTRAIA